MANRAYPRLRGGTQALFDFLDYDQGLSPLARGNQSVPVLAKSSARPIPACAGEPESEIDGRNHGGAYPRLRGGTCWPSCPSP